MGEPEQWKGKKGAQQQPLLTKWRIAVFIALFVALFITGFFFGQYNQTSKWSNSMENLVTVCESQGQVLRIRHDYGNLVPRCFGSLPVDDTLPVI